MKRTLSLFVLLLGLTLSAALTGCNNDTSTPPSGGSASNAPAGSNAAPANP